MANHGRLREIRGPRLHDRRQQIEQQARLGASRGVSGALLLVDQAGEIKPERESALGIGLLLWQHAPDVFFGVADDRDRRRGRVLGRYVAALHAIQRIIERDVETA